MPLGVLTPGSLTTALKEEAARLGFDLAGATPAVAPADIDRFDRWLADGYAGQMRYMADRAEAYRHPRHVHEEAKSILMLALNYRTVTPESARAGQGSMSRYAWGSDYHDLVRRKLHRLADFHRQLVPTARVRGVVDTAPLLERWFAQQAGLGWIGKNSLLVNERFGSWLFLGALLTSETLEYDRPLASGRCGSCRACLDACPTGAMVEPYRLDARRCCSYLTIELRGAIPPEFRSALGDRWFGCDACQEACPWNRRTSATAEAELCPRPDQNPVELVELFTADEATLRRRFRDTPLGRSKRRGLLRNAAVVLGNCRPHAALAALQLGLEDPEPLVRGACAWALGRYDDETANAALHRRLEVESDPDVRREIEAATMGPSNDV